eukprot:scaffold33646_cov142-Skeletonema_dohrnii-CCMP3373.AAC.1
MEAADPKGSNEISFPLHRPSVLILLRPPLHQVEPGADSTHTNKFVGNDNLRIHHEKFNGNDHFCAEKSKAKAGHFLVKSWTCTKERLADVRTCSTLSSALHALHRLSTVSISS